MFESWNAPASRILNRTGGTRQIKEQEIERSSQYEIGTRSVPRPANRTVSLFYLFAIIHEKKRKLFSPFSFVQVPVILFLRYKILLSSSFAKKVLVLLFLILSNFESYFPFLNAFVWIYFVLNSVSVIKVQDELKKAGSYTTISLHHLPFAWNFYSCTWIFCWDESACDVGYFCKKLISFSAKCQRNVFVNNYMKNCELESVFFYFYCFCFDWIFFGLFKNFQWQFH